MVSESVQGLIQAWQVSLETISHEAAIHHPASSVAPAIGSVATLEIDTWGFTMSISFPGVASAECFALFNAGMKQYIIHLFQLYLHLIHRECDLQKE